MTATRPTVSPPRDRPPQRSPERRIDSRELLDARGQLIIDHQGRVYQLRETRNGKLILTS